MLSPLVVSEVEAAQRQRRDTDSIPMAAVSWLAVSWLSGYWIWLSKSVLLERAIEIAGSDTRCSITPSNNQIAR